MSVISRLNQVLLEDTTEVSRTDSVSFVSQSSESYRYLSSREPSITTSRDGTEDLSLEELEFLRERARQFNAQKVSTKQVPSTTPNLNFKPDLNLLQRHNPLSQSTPLILKRHEPPKTTGSNLLSVLTELEDHESKVDSLAVDLVSKHDSVDLSPVIKGSSESDLLKSGTALEQSKVSKNDPSSGTLLDIKKESMPGSQLNHESISTSASKHSLQSQPVSKDSDESSDGTKNSKSALVNNESIRNEETQAISELERLRLFLSKSDMGVTLLKEFESGISKSSSSESLAQKIQENLQSSDTIEVIQSLETQLEEAEEKIQKLENEKIQNEDLIKDKNSMIQEMTDQLYQKDKQVTELSQEFEVLQEKIIAVIGDESQAFVSDPAYKSLNLNEIDQLSLIELQNVVKKMLIKLNVRYEDFDEFASKISRFFVEDYVKLVVFINSLHLVIYPQSTLKLPDVYKLSWTSNEYLANDVDDIKDFEHCLNEMIEKAKVLWR